MIGPDGVSSFRSELDEVMKRSAEPDFIGLANKRLVSTLSKNLANMELFSKREAVSSLHERVHLMFLTSCWSSWSPRK